MTAVNPSTFCPTSTWNEPIWKKGSELVTGAPPATKWAMIAIETTKLRKTAAIPISEPRRRIRLPKNTMRKNDTAGNDGTSQANLCTRYAPPSSAGRPGVTT